MRKKQKPAVPVLIFIVLILQLVFLYYLKYSNQGLSISDFSLNNLGNILNLVFTLSLITGIYFYSKKKGNTNTPIIIFTIILILSLLISYLFTTVQFPSKKVYIFGQPGGKVLDAAIFTIYQYIMFTFISYVWLKIFSSGRLILLRSFLNGIFMLFFFICLAFLYIQTSGYSNNYYSLSRDKNNLGVVLGAAVWSNNKPSPSLAARVDKAIDLYKKGFIGSILLTGSNAPGELTEAAVAYNYAKKSGIDTNKIHIETNTTSTTGQIRYVKNNLIDVPGISQVIIISDAYHLVRVMEISKFSNIHIKLAASNLKLDYKTKLYREIRESVALIVFWSFAL
ncbi:hypothetical protein BMS3Abin03_03143 [bacterium BMS3Abin03]|nr:hypothetical protein BMS3Abin03_03143 [bacterium BMS3Abin03]